MNILSVEIHLKFRPKGVQQTRHHQCIYQEFEVPNKVFANQLGIYYSRRVILGMNFVLPPLQLIGDSLIKTNLNLKRNLRQIPPTSSQDLSPFSGILQKQHPTNEGLKVCRLMLRPYMQNEVFTVGICYFILFLGHTNSWYIMLRPNYYPAVNW